MKMTDFCAEIKNYFDVKRAYGKYTISGGSIVIDDMQEGQFFRIIGSVFNDGVYQYPASGLKSETFDGSIWYMAVPPDVVSLVEEMSAWEDKNAAVLDSPYSSESFGGYSYSKASGSGISGGDGSATAFSHFADKLKLWRKVRCV